MSTPPDDDAGPPGAHWSRVTRPLPVLRRVRQVPRGALAAVAAAAALTLAAVAYLIPARMVPYIGQPASHTVSGLIAVPGAVVTRTRTGTAVTLPGAVIPGPVVTRAGPGSAAAYTRTVPGQRTVVTSVLPGATETVPGQDVTATAPGPAATETATETVTETAPGPAVTETVPGPIVTETVTETVPGPAETVTQIMPGSAPPG